MASGFMYLTAIIDVYSRFIVGWYVGNSLDASVSVDVLKMAIERYGKPEIVNSDQGSQYTSKEWISCIKSYKTADSEIKISMDGNGRATDNIWIERFWRTIKRGYVYLNPAENGIELHRGVCDYIEYYNYSRGPTAHDGLSPCVVYGVYRAFNIESSLKALHYTKRPHTENRLQIN